MSETDLKLKKRELGILIFRTFTRELIINSGGVYFAKLQTIIEKDYEKEKEKEHKEPKQKIKLQELQREKEKKFQEKLKEQKLRNQIIEREQTRRIIEQKRNVVFEKLKLSVPETRLPERFAYLKPIPIEEKEEFGKVDILLQDPNVEAIECPGENEELIVKGTMGEQKTEIKLSKKEIDNLINKFSELTKIPVSEGIYKVVFGKLILLAVISEVVGSKFLIKKMKKPIPLRSQTPGAPLPDFPPPRLPQTNLSSRPTNR
jgi:hypothetical protein